MQTCICWKRFSPNILQFDDIVLISLNSTLWRFWTHMRPWSSLCLFSCTQSIFFTWLSVVTSTLNLFMQKQTDRHGHHNTPLPYRGRINNSAHLYDCRFSFNCANSRACRQTDILQFDDIVLIQTALITVCRRQFVTGLGKEWHDSQRLFVNKCLMHNLIRVLKWSL